MGGWIKVCMYVLNRKGSHWPILPPAVTSKEGRLLYCLLSTLPTHVPRLFCLGRRSVLLTLHPSSLVPGGAITDTITFISIAANKRNLKLW